jgi:hypothetical protein
LSILAPAGRFLVNLDETDHPGEGRIVELSDGTKKREIVRYRATHVFDISQTDSIDTDEHPKEHEPGRNADTHPVAETLTVEVVDVEQLRTRLAEHVSTAGYTLSYGTPTAGADGHTDPQTRSVVVGNHLTALEHVATLAHELAHIAIGHCAPSYAYHAHRGRAEVEAESVAYVVLGACGIDMTDAPIRYVAGWAGGDIDTIRTTAATVTTTAKTLLDTLLDTDTETQTDVETPVAWS